MAVQYADGGGSSTIVGINYGVIEAGLSKYRSQKRKMEGYVTQIQHLKTNPPEDWTGEDAALLDQIMVDAEKGLSKIDSNIESVKKWLDFSKQSHQANEGANAKALADAYANLTK